MVDVAQLVRALVCREKGYMVDVAQLVRALVCGTKGRGFESHLPPSVSLTQPAFM